MKTEKRAYAVHDHAIIRGPRSHRLGNWPAGTGSKIVHSHEGGEVAHTHPDTGPCHLSGGKAKSTARPNGEQLTYVKTDSADLVFDLFILDSAVAMGDLAKGSAGNHGDPFLMPAAERMKNAFGLRAIVHDLRTRRAGSSK